MITIALRKVRVRRYSSMDDIGTFDYSYEKKLGSVYITNWV
jgi:hypothetical protein